MTLVAGGHVFISLLLILPFAGAQPSTVDPQNPDPYGRFNPSMAVIIVILIAALFFMAFFSIYIRHCNGGPSSVSRSVRLRSAIRAAPRGLDPAVIETFPTFVYSTVKGLKIGKGALECAVCLCEFEDDETLRLIPKCDHVFHPECIDAWLEAHTTCPVCRADLVPKPGESVPQLAELGAESREDDAVREIEEQSRNVGAEEVVVSVAPQVPAEGIDLNGKLNGSRTRGSRSGRPHKFPRSHSTGHSLVQPGENTERFTLRLPTEVRREIMNRKLNRASSMVILPREGSSRRGYRTGSIRGKYYRRIEEELEPEVKSDKWGFEKVRPFLSRMSSSVRSLSIRSLSIRSPKVNSGEGGSVRSPKGNFSEGGSVRSVEPVATPVQLNRPPV